MVAGGGLENSGTSARGLLSPKMSSCQFGLLCHDGLQDTDRDQKTNLLHSDEHITWKWMGWSRKEDYFPLRTGGAIHFHVRCFVGVHTPWNSPRGVDGRAP